MKLSNKQQFYLHVAILFVFTYSLASKVISGFKTNNFDYFRIGISLILVVFTILNIIKYANKENNQNDTDQKQ